jgi:hypothetical protein
MVSMARSSPFLPFTAHLSSDEFLHALVNILAGEDQPIGDGQLSREIREVQRLYWKPPPMTELRSTGNMHTRRRVGAAIP